MENTHTLLKQYAPFFVRLEETEVFDLIKEIGINPNKPLYEVTLKDMYNLSLFVSHCPIDIMLQMLTELPEEYK